MALSIGVQVSVAVLGGPSSTSCSRRSMERCADGIWSVKEEGRFGRDFVGNFFGLSPDVPPKERRTTVGTAAADDVVVALLAFKGWPGLSLFLSLLVGRAGFCLGYPLGAVGPWG